MISYLPLHGAEAASGAFDFHEYDTFVGELHAVDGVTEKPKSFGVPRPSSGEGNELLRDLAVASALAALGAVQCAKGSAEASDPGR